MFICDGLEKKRFIRLEHYAIREIDLYKLFRNDNYLDDFG